MENNLRLVVFGDKGFTKFSIPSMEMGLLKCYSLQKLILVNNIFFLKNLLISPGFQIFLHGRNFKNYVYFKLSIFFYFGVFLA